MQRHPKREPFNCPDPAVFERMAEVEKTAAISWQAVTDFQGTVERGFAEVNRRLDTLNGHIAHLHTWRDRSLGALAVLSLIVTSFGATALVLAVGK